MTRVVAPVQRGRRRLWWGLAVIVVACGAFGAWYAARDRSPGRTPPEVALEGVDYDVARAIQKAREEVLRDPRSSSSWGGYGEVLNAHVFSDEALECYAQAELLDPKEPRWPYLQGMIHYPDRPEEALTKLRRAAELAPEKPDVVVLRLAELSLSLGRTDEARERFEALLRLDPNHARARLGLARLALSAADYAACERHASACLGNPYGRKAARALLSEVRHRQGAPDAREQDPVAQLPPDLAWPDPFSQAMNRRKVGEKARLRHATQLMDEGQNGEATSELQRIVADYPTSASSWMTLGYALVMARDDVNAERALTRAIELDPSQPRSYLYLGIIRHRRGDRTAAAAQFRIAITAKPDFALAYFNLGLTLKEDGQRVQAVQAFRDALRVQPGHAQAHAQLGELLLQDGLKEEGRTHLENAVRLNPRDKRSADLLAGLKK